MKKNYIYLSIVFLISISVANAQNNDFLNGDGDQLWSNALNWSLGVVPNTTNTAQVRLPLPIESLVDTDISIKKLQNTFATSVDVPIGGSETLTIDAGSGGAFGIENVSNDDVSLIFNGNLAINNSAGVNAFTFFRSQNGNTNDLNNIIFENGSTLNLLSNTGVESGSGSNTFVFNGELTGNKNLRFGTNTTSIFGTTSTNPSYTGELVFLFNSSVIVNTADNNIFYNGFKLQINGNNASIEVNGENVLESRIVITASNTFTFTVNENQNNLERLNFNTGSTLDLNLGANVTNLSFEENASVDWSTGTLNITGFKEGVIRFGTDNTGLTSGQLNQIIADNGGKDLMLDADGYLVNVPDFTYSGGLWTPSNIGDSGTTDNIFIQDGSVDFSTTLVANNLRIETGATVNVTSTGILDLNGDIINKGNLVFKSDATGSGQLDSFSGFIIGNIITAERFIPARSDGERAFRFMASPVGNVNIADAWQQQIHITGSQAGNNGFDASTTGAPSMFTYDHSVETQNQPWVAVSTTQQDIVAGKPYRIFVRGDRSTINLSNTSTDDADDVTLSATGELHVGDYNVTTSNFVENYTFVGNPYQAIVDLNNLTYGANVNSNYAYYWDPKLDNAGGFVAIALPGGTPDPGSSNANNFLRPGQAVFIRNEASGSDFSITITENDKATSGTQTQVFSNNTTAFLNMRLYTTEKYNNAETEEDATGLRFLMDGNNEVDQMDAVKMGNPGVNLAVVNGNTPLAIETRALPENEENIQFFISNLTTESYTFRFHMEYMPENMKALLQDAYTDEQFEIEPGINTLDFSSDENIPNSISPLRFSIVFEESTLDVNDLETFTSVEIYPNPTTSILNLQGKELANQQVHINIVDVVGRSVQQLNQFTGDNTIIELDTSKLNQGIYFLKINTSNGLKFTERFIKK